MKQGLDLKEERKEGKQQTEIWFFCCHVSTALQSWKENRETWSPLWTQIQRTGEKANTINSIILNSVRWYTYSRGFPGGASGTETWVPSLGREGPGGKRTATLTSLAWEIPRTEELAGLESAGTQSQTRLKQLSMPTRILTPNNNTLHLLYVWTELSHTSSLLK